VSSPLILGKIAAIERSVARAREEFAAAGAHFHNDFTRQDAAILNILRGCEQALDVANILVRERQFGMPQSSRDSFKLLVDAGLIDPALGSSLQRMIGFRNIAVHQYQQLDLAIVEAILRRDLDHLLAYSGAIAKLD
jgi:uncharacterized protein YutE (UPF0331/DUF86 family)